MHCTQYSIISVNTELNVLIQYTQKITAKNLSNNNAMNWKGKTTEP
jgi:hypothetical protein